MNTVKPISKPGAPIPPGQTQPALLERLRAGGVFRALVVANSGGSLELDTPFGRLATPANERLRVGDEILARLSESSSQPTIRIIQRSAKLLSLPQRLLAQLLPKEQQDPILARVLPSSGQSTRIQSGEKILSLPHQPELQKGDHILLRPARNQQVDILRIRPESLLKSALSILLPKIPDPAAGLDVTRLQRFARQMLAADAALFSAPARKSPDYGLAQQTSIAAANTAAHSTVSGQLKSLLTSLAAPTLSATQINADTLARLLGYLEMIGPTRQSPSPATTLPGMLVRLLQRLHESPDSFRMLVQELFSRPQAKMQRPISHEQALPELAASLRNELIQQADLTLTQLLTQKTSSALQLEQNNPIQMHLNIPLQADNDTRNLSLKIRQKTRPEEDAEAAWEINLAFEFGQLGPVITHIQLQGEKVSAQFWAQRPETKHLIENNLDSFRNRMQICGFIPGMLDCYLGKPRPRAESPALSLSENMVDLKA